ncbi:mechanosensitive ion channel domain-containing protein [Chitinophaga silvisoli]|uniref:Mechanosensitive ion channel protein n=1 Tax=Chitinophaga silvisoli TaxID=2291814 RepID=A0A3E1P2J7_9BACT|nr:mechanosensitive ion channel domain-containing protein [Chitinophaga silvisoli]RFM34350.1 mechanosensitive ion channel protein [Chitinophaga silvisoli]
MKKPILLLLLIALTSSFVLAQKAPPRAVDTTLFGDNNQATRSDYLAGFEKVFQTMNKVPLVTSSFTRVQDIQAHLKDADSILEILKDRFAGNDKSLNIRNLQMYQSLLEELDNTMNEFGKVLNGYDQKLDDVRKEIRDLRKDTLMRGLFRDSALRATFIPQLQTLRTKFRRADSLVKANTAILNDLKAKVSTDAIVIEELGYQTEEALKTAGGRAFTKERLFLWEPVTAQGRRPPPGGFKKSVNAEQQLASYYFRNTRSKRSLLWIIGIAFFVWINYNFRSLKKLNKLSAIKEFDFKYVKALPWLMTCVLILNLAPLFDHNAPAIYIETTQFMLMVLLTPVFYKILPRQIFMGWGLFMLLFLFLPIIRVLGLPIRLMRYANVVHDLVAVVIGLLYIQIRSFRKEYRLMWWAVILYTFLNTLAVLMNIFGRVTLSQIFSATAVYALAQAASLSIFVQLVIEAFLLQIQGSRIRKRYPEHFDVADIKKSLFRFISVLAVLIWAIVFSTNLNIYDAFSTGLKALFQASIVIGSSSFTIGGVVLFLGIIWIANFLQKYIAYFFGDIGDDAAFDDKGQRSRLLVTRLILLVLAFLLAISASGLPVDKITVILGALGVGIGLGLQSIVNNFVSGIILIFDRPLRIGDTVEIGSKKGRVKEIGIRSSTLLTEDGAEVILPNGDVLSKEITNWTLSNNNARINFNYKVAKLEDAATVKQELKDLIAANDQVMARREIEIIMNFVSATVMSVRIAFWCRDIMKVSVVEAEINNAIYNYFEQKGIVTQ